MIKILAVIGFIYLVIAANNAAKVAYYKIRKQEFPSTPGEMKLEVKLSEAIAKEELAQALLLAERERRTQAEETLVETINKLQEAARR